jgi:DNA polymerase III delta subunit
MLFVFYGNGTVAVRQKAFNFVVTQEELGFKLERIEAENYVAGTCADIVGAMSLFGDKTIYVLDTPSLDSVFFAEVESTLSPFKESTNIFVIIEGKMLAPEKKKYTKFAENIEEIESATEVRFNAFAMADALTVKDKKRLWLLLTEALQAGLSPEEIIGTLWWQLKMLRLAKITKNAEDAGMKEYPYSKAKRALVNFKEGELETLSRSLLSLYHDGHVGKKDIELGLEKWTLTI